MKKQVTMKGQPIDNQAALDTFRKEEHAPGNPVRSADDLSIQPTNDGYVELPGDGQSLW